MKAPQELSPTERELVNLALIAIAASLLEIRAVVRAEEEPTLPHTSQRAITVLWSGIQTLSQVLDATQDEVLDLGLEAMALFHLMEHILDKTRLGRLLDQISTHQSKN